MYFVYAVRLINGVKHRHFISEAETIDAAKHVANCTTCGNADYAYIKEIGGGTVFFIRSPDYDEAPLNLATPPRQMQSLTEQ